MPKEELENLLAVLVQQSRALATRMAGSPEISVPCHFCGAAMPLWENLLVQQLAGVPAHVQCPTKVLEKRLKQIGPLESFPYEEFSKAIDNRVKKEKRIECSGTIETNRNPTFEQAHRLLVAHGQEHVLSWFDELDTQGQTHLLSQIQEIDLDWLDKNWDHKDASLDPATIKPYEQVIHPSDSDSTVARAVGERALREGRVCALLVAGGKGTRLGFDGPKGAFPIGAVSGRTLFEIHTERLLALGNRFGVVPALYLMTSQDNHEDTCKIFAQHKNFGLPADRVLIFTQGVLPAVDVNGKLLLAARDQLVLTANGNGGLFSAMQAGGVFDHMKIRGVDTISYVQIDNPLAQSCDPLFVGYHLQRDCEFSCKAIQKMGPFEKVGNYALVDENLAIVEYTEIPGELVTKTNSEGALLFDYGNPGLFIWSRAFAERQAKRKALSFHRAFKKIPYLDLGGNFVEPRSPNGFKFECFVLDALADAKRVLLLACEREAEFAPVKNSVGTDSPEIARALMTNLYRGWIKAAGGKIKGDGPIEISALYALDQNELKEKLPEGFSTEGNLYLSPK
ncbi:MAG: UTP--glucose-1-phosphate uridylyltransferase [Pseudomonadota bacterium]